MSTLLYCALTRRQIRQDLNFEFSVQATRVCTTRKSCSFSVGSCVLLESSFLVSIVKLLLKARNPPLDNRKCTVKKKKKEIPASVYPLVSNHVHVSHWKSVTRRYGQIYSMVHDTCTAKSTSKYLSYFVARDSHTSFYAHSGEGRQKRLSFNKKIEGI